MFAIIMAIVQVVSVVMGAVMFVEGIQEGDWGKAIMGGMMAAVGMSGLAASAGAAASNAGATATVASNTANTTLGTIGSTTGSVVPLASTVPVSTVAANTTGLSSIGNVATSTLQSPVAALAPSGMAATTAHVAASAAPTFSGMMSSLKGFGTSLEGTTKALSPLSGGSGLGTLAQFAAASGQNKSAQDTLDFNKDIINTKRTNMGTVPDSVMKMSSSAFDRGVV